jgi:hypothetical protein
MLSKDGKLLLDRRELLRVKVKSLADEATIIRREEKRARGVIRDELRWHRVTDLRIEARLSFIAYGLIRGRKLEQLEPRTRAENALRKPQWDRVAAMLKKFGPPAGMELPDLKLAA